MSRIKTIFAAAAASLALTGAADAALVTVRDNPNNGSSAFASGLGRNVWISHDGSNRAVSAGVFSLQFSDGGAWTDFLTFCLQIDEHLSLPREHQRVADQTYFPTASDRNAVGALYGNFLTAGTGLKDSTSAAALQTIIWEITEDGAANFNLSSGSFKVLSTDVLSKAQTFWAQIISGDYKPLRFDVFAANGSQDLLTSEVPIPGAALLFGSALAGFSFARRQRKS
ncbi:MAG: hypothetical protein KDD85_06450 [Parvularculaceae bacterium]|nr:hypothetical protein [Parvularculaceae bacterium]